MFFSKLLNLFKAHTFTSTENEPISIGQSFRKKAIFVGTTPQSGGEYIYMWSNVIKTLKQKKFNPKKCLVLGVAGGTVINELKKNYSKIAITGVELDPAILNVAIENNFFKVDQNTKIEIGDAFEWVKTNHNKYQLIIVDLYLGALNPAKARQKPFLREIKTKLKINGIVIYNCHFQQNKYYAYEAFLRNAKQVFSKIEEIFIFPKNKILLFESD